jgi:formamidopyrimidine-DNA glycosylase
MLIGPDVIEEFKKHNFCEECIAKVVEGSILNGSKTFCKKCSDIVESLKEDLIKSSYREGRNKGLCEHCSTRLSYSLITEEEYSYFCPNCKTIVNNLMENNP